MYLVSIENQVYSRFREDLVCKVEKYES